MTDTLTLNKGDKVRVGSACYDRPRGWTASSVYEVVRVEGSTALLAVPDGWTCGDSPTGQGWHVNTQFLTRVEPDAIAPGTKVRLLPGATLSTRMSVGDVLEVREAPAHSTVSAQQYVCVRPLDDSDGWAHTNGGRGWWVERSYVEVVPSDTASSGGQGTDEAEAEIQARIQAAVTQALDEYKERVREYIMVKRREHDWCNDGVGRALRHLDLRPLEVDFSITFRVTAEQYVTVNLTSSDEDDAIDRARELVDDNISWSAYDWTVEDCVHYETELL